jgi:hypothetical protein
MSAWSGLWAWLCVQLPCRAFKCQKEQYANARESVTTSAQTLPVSPALASPKTKSEAPPPLPPCRTLLQVGGPPALSWGAAAPEASLNALLQPVQRLLQPGMGDSASHYVGGLVLELLRHAGDLLVSRGACDL